MAVAETAKLIVDLSLKGNFAQQLGKASKATKQFDRDASRAYKAGSQIGTGIKRGAVLAAGGVAFLGFQIAQGLQSVIELEKATAQTNAVLKSTGKIAGVTAADVRTLAEKYESLNATVGDEFIIAGQNLLLTFTNIRKKAFEPALKTALDMNTALGRDQGQLTDTVRVLGKALNDPTKGLTALGRVGIKFTATQEKQIKAAVKAGDVFKAQGIILAELNKRFGGSFLAGGNTTAGKVAKFQDAIDDLQRALAAGLLPVVGNIADALSDFLADEQTQRDIEHLGDEIAKLFSPQAIRGGIDALKSGFGFIKSIAGPIADVVKTAVNAFTSLPPEIQKLAVGAFAVNKLTGGLVTNLAGGVISGVLGAFKGVMKVSAGVVQVNGPVAGGGGGIAGAAGGGSKLTKALGILGAIIPAIGVIATQQEVSGASSTQAGDVAATAKVFLGNSPTTDALQRALAGTEKGIADLKSNPLTILVRGDALEKLEATRAAILKQIGEAQTTRVEANRGVALLGQKTDDSRSKITAAQAETKRETARGDALVRAQTATSGANIVGAIHSIDVRPVVNVHVTPQVTTINRRYGIPVGSRWIDRPDKVQ